MFVTMSVPPHVSTPYMLATSFVNGDLLISNIFVLPEFNVSELLNVSAPGKLPGDSVPPEFTVVAPEIIPPPPSVPPEATITAPNPVPLPPELFTRNSPPLIVVPPL